MDAIHFNFSCLPEVTRSKTKNVLLLLEDGRKEYRDVPLDQLFSYYSQKYLKKCQKKVYKAHCHLRDERIAAIYIQMTELVRASPELGYRLPENPFDNKLKPIL